MAGQNELEIVLKLVDEASDKLKAINADIKKDTADVTEEQKKQGDESDKSQKKQQDGLMKTSKELKSFRRELFAVTAAIGAITLTTKAWAENNIQARTQLDTLGQSTNRLMGAIGSVLMPLISVAEVLVKVLGYAASGWAGIIGLFTEGIDKAEEAFNKFNANLSQGVNLKEMTDQMKLMRDALERIDLMYMTGKMTAQQYYDTLTSGNAAAYQGDLARMQLTKQLAQEENLIRNQSLMDYQTDVQARMELLKTFESYHHTAYSTMADFANMAIQKISTGMTSTLTGIIMGTKKAGEAWKEFGISMITSIVEFVIQYTIQMLIAAALATTIMATTVAEATALAAAWLPAAIFASIATLGGADVAGVAGFAAATSSSMAIGLGTIVVSKVLSAGAGGGFAEGGRPPVGRASIVGERGPELFVPDSSGVIIPNNRLSGLGSQTSIHIEVNNPVLTSQQDIDYLTEEISRKLAREAERI
jgi:hypothetical protein